MTEDLSVTAKGEKRVRADAQRNLDALLQAAKAVFATSGVDAPVREIADKAGVGIGTLYRHFPQRADLIAAVFRREIDACADAAPLLAAEHPPFEALGLWLQRYAVFIAAKRGLAPALHSGNPAFLPLRDHFEGRVRPALDRLLDGAIAAGMARREIDADDLLTAVSILGMSGYTDNPDKVQRMVALVVEGLRRRGEG